MRVIKLFIPAPHILYSHSSLPQKHNEFLIFFHSLEDFALSHALPVASLLCQIISTIKPHATSLQKKPRECSLCLWYRKTNVGHVKDVPAKDTASVLKSFINLLSHTASWKECPTERLAESHNNKRWGNGSRHYMNHSVWYQEIRVKHLNV